MKKWMILTLVMVFMSGPIVWSAGTTASTAAQVVADVGNKMCPVSGEEVTGKHFVEYNGKRYGLCCPMCANKFKRDPEKYLKKMGSQGAADSHDGHDHQH